MTRLAITTGLLSLAFTGAAVSAEPSPRLPLLPNDDAWRRLPGAPDGVQPLPGWARILAGPHPLTTARMLELDALHRTGDRLDARFRAVVRWAAADANRSPYAKAMAAADLARAGGDPASLPARAGADGGFPTIDRLAAAFARKMMLDATTVTDAEVKELLDLLGEERVMALVALVAHASFQDRILLALAVEPEAGGVPPPVTARFARPQPKAPPARPARPPEPPSAPPTADRPTVTDDWLRLQQGLDEQRKRPGRIRVPAREEVVRRLGENHPALWQAGIVWSRIAYGYQPELTDAWFDCSAAFRQESTLDPLFQNSVFWVVTDSLRCFY
jgi:alkylhydroperoxidase family enzyme